MSDVVEDDSLVDVSPTGENAGGTVVATAPQSVVDAQKRADPENPREMKDYKFDALQDSMARYGDLSCIVWNRRNGLLVGGHRRIDGMIAKFKDAPITITEMYGDPNEVGTTAEGYIEVGGERFKYREVDWDDDKHRAANVAANNINGDFSDDLPDYMAKISKEMQQFTGHSEKELKRLEKLSSAPEEPDGDGDEDDDKPEDERLVFAMTKLQSDAVRRALAECKSNHNIQSDITKDADGEALYLMAQEYLATHGKTEQPASPPPEPEVG